MQVFISFQIFFLKIARVMLNYRNDEALMVISNGHLMASYSFALSVTFSVDKVLFLNKIKWNPTPIKPPNTPYYLYNCRKDKEKLDKQNKIF